MSLAVLAARHCRSGGQRLVGVGGVAAAVKSEQRLGAGILELEADIALAQRRAQHYGKAAELQDAVVGGNETGPVGAGERDTAARPVARSEEHTSELQSLMRNSYAVFCLKKNTILYNTLILIN